MVAAETEQNLENLDKLESTKKSSIFPQTYHTLPINQQRELVSPKIKKQEKSVILLRVLIKKGHARRTISVDRYGSSMSKKSNLSPLVKSGRHKSTERACAGSFCPGIFLGLY